MYIFECEYIKNRLINGKIFLYVFLLIRRTIIFMNFYALYYIKINNNNA